MTPSGDRVNWIVVVDVVTPTPFGSRIFVDIYACCIRYVSNRFLDYIRCVSNGILDQSGSPSIFSLGYCAVSYAPQAQVSAVANSFFSARSPA